MIRKTVACLLLSLSGLVTIQADVFIVDSSGGGDFQDLQVAIDSVPEGSTLLVNGTHDPITVDKSLAIIGGRLFWGHSQNPDAGIEVTNVEWLYLQDMDVGVGNPSEFHELGSHGLLAENVGRLQVVDCRIVGTNYWPLDGGECYDWGPYHGVILDNVGVARFQGCDLEGAEGVYMWAFSGYEPCEECELVLIAGVAGDGMRVENSLALLEDCTVTGGDGGFATWNVDPEFCDFPPEWVQGGNGGHAIVGDVFASNLNATGGIGGEFVYTWTDWGIGALGLDGLPIQGQLTSIPKLASMTSIAEPGEMVTISAEGLQPSSMALTLLSADLVSPLATDQGLWFLANPIFNLGTIPTNAGGQLTLQRPLPNMPSLLGTSIAIQITDLQLVTEPECLMIACTSP